jgi:hypothetical protein
LPDLPALENTLYAPVRLEVLEYYKGGETGVNEILVAHDAGTVADMNDSLMAFTQGIPASELHVGDEAMLFVVPIPAGASRPDKEHVEAEAQRP